MDPVVRSKVDFTKSEADLAKHIDPKHLKKVRSRISIAVWRSLIVCTVDGWCASSQEETKG